MPPTPSQIFVFHRHEENSMYASSVWVTSTDLEKTSGTPYTGYKITACTCAIMFGNLARVLSWVGVLQTNDTQSLAHVRVRAEAYYLSRSCSRARVACFHIK